MNSADSENPHFSLTRKAIGLLFSLKSNDFQNLYLPLKSKGIDVSFSHKSTDFEFLSFDQKVKLLCGFPLLLTFKNSYFHKW